MSSAHITVADVRTHKSEIDRLASKYHVGNVRLFGSVVRCSATNTSDIDFLVDPQSDCSGFDIGGLYEELGALLGRPVDVVTPRSLQWFIRDSVLDEAVTL